MPTKAEKERRKQIQRELKAKEYENFLNGLPIDKEILMDLFDFLDTEIENQGCNHDYSLTETFLKERNIDSNLIFEWFEENGGYCDCEILFNVEEKFEE